MKGIISFFMISICMFLQSGIAYGEVPVQDVKKEMKYMMKQEPHSYAKLSVASMQNEVLFRHRDTIRHEDTLYNIKNSSLVKVKQISLSKAERYIPAVSQYIAKFSKENVQVYYIAVHYETTKENAYQRDGMNYFLQVFVQEQGNWRIAESIVAPSKEMMKNGDGFGIEEERKK